MAEWLVEHGIGEQRAIRLEDGHVTAARLHWPGRLTAGQVEDAVLVHRPAGNARGRARFANGEEALIDKLPGDAQEGAALRLEVTRSRIGERGRTKLAQARPTAQPPRPAPALEESLTLAGESARVVRSFPDERWEEVWSDAWSGTIAFAGGAMHFSPTPAMLLVDIDGDLPRLPLCLAAIEPLARAIGRFDLAGSIGIDFPTLPDKADRRKVDEALALALADWPHQGTAMNGFGFVQLVARLERPSLLNAIAVNRVGAAARMLLRRAERVSDPGTLLLTCHPAIKARLRPEWLDELSRRTGREVRIETDPALALDAGFAQAVPA